MAPIHSRPLLASRQRRLLAAIILLSSSHANSVIVRGESSWCSSSFEGEPQQQITDEVVNRIAVSWLRDRYQTAGNGGSCGQLPRATWTIEPAPEGVNTTQIWMLPPNLGHGLVDYSELVVAINETFIDNNDNNATEIGVLIQVPKDQLRSVNIDSPLRVNIAPGFTNLTSLSVDISSAQNAGYYQGKNYTCGKYPVPGAGEELSLAGLGAEVRADLSTVEGDISLRAGGWGGNDIAVKLPKDGYPLAYMSLKGNNARYYIEGNVNCTNPYDYVFQQCYFTGGSADLCKGDDCFSQLVIDGEINGNVTVPSYLQSGVVSVAKVSAPGGCDQFEPENPAIFDCTDGAAANTTVEVEPLPCTMQEENMTLADVVECPTHFNAYVHKGFSMCNCYVPTSETCPEQPSPASFGAMLSKTVSFGFTGMLCYALSMLVL